MNSSDEARGLAAVEKLAAIEEIKAVFAKRLRVMDTKQWPLYPTCHTEDVVSETFPGARNRVVGSGALTTAISELLDGSTKITTVHHGHSPEIEFTSLTTARAIWAMEDRLWWTNGDAEEHLHGYGDYHEEYRKVSGHWLISYRRLTRLRVDVTADFYSYLTGPG